MKWEIKVKDPLHVVPVPEVFWAEVTCRWVLILAIEAWLENGAGA